MKIRYLNTLTVPIAVLTLLFTIFSFLVLQERYEKISALNKLSNGVSFVSTVTELMHALQVERGESVGYLATEGEKFSKELYQTRNNADRLIRLLFETYENTKSLHFESYRYRYEILRRRLGMLEKIRKKVDELAISRDKVLRYYSLINEKILDIFAETIELSKEPNITKELLALSSLLEMKEIAGLERAIGTEILGCQEREENTCDKERETLTQFIVLHAKEDIFEKYFKRFANGDFQRYFTERLENAPDNSLRRYEKFVDSLTYSKRFLSRIDAKTWFKVASIRIERLKATEDYIVSTITQDIRKTLQKNIYIFIGYLFFNLISLVLFIYMVMRIEQILKREKELTKLVDENVIVSVTDKKGIITDVSRAFEKISGYTREELIGKPHNVIRHPDMPKEFFCRMWEEIKSDKRWEGEIKNRRKDGSCYWVSAVISPIYDKYGRKIGYSAVRQDISDKKRYEKLSETLEKKVKEELERNKEQQAMMLHQSRLAQMGEMISMIAHQWRQPLSVISSVCAIMEAKSKRGALTEEEVDNYLGRIRMQTRYLSDTIEDFRNFFKPDKAKTQTTYEEIVAEALRIVETSLHSRGITIEREFKNQCVLFTYANEIKQVLLNLIKNAEDALMENGVDYPYISIMVDGYTLVVKDNAGGIPEEYIDRIFEPYFSTKSSKDGTGLGLYMSKTIVEEHCGGRLEVRNDEKGAVFTIVLPQNDT